MLYSVPAKRGFAVVASCFVLAGIGKPVRAATDPVSDRVTLRFGEGATCTAAGQGAHEDTWVSQGFPDSRLALSGEVAGSAPYLYFRYVSGLNNVLLRFDLSAIPQGVLVRQATLRLFTNYTYNPDSNDAKRCITKPIYAITDPDGTGGWGETEATWNSKRTGVRWATGGNILNALGPQIGSMFFKNFLSGSYARQDWYESDITSAVQGWVNNPSSNLGFVVTNDARFNRTFRSRENPDATLRPYLEVTYDAVPASVPPAPTGVSAKYHAGQTFVTWTEAITGRDETSYRVYRSDSPIDAANLRDAHLLGEVYQGSSYLTDSVFGDPSYIKQPQLGRIGVSLGPNSGLFVQTATADGPGYYAVTTVAEGQENRAVVAGANATTEAVPESVAEIEPYKVNEQPGYYTGYVFWMSPANTADPADPFGFDNRPYAPFFFAVTPPYQRSGTKPYPLTLYLHASNKWYFGSEEGVDNARGDTGYCLGFQDTTRIVVRDAAGQLRDLGPYLETNAYGYSKYRGWNSNYTSTTIVNGFRKSLAPVRPWAEGRSVMYAEKAMRFTAEWVMRHSKWFLGGGDFGTEIDPNRVYATGGSLGGSGALHLGVHLADLIAAVNVYKGRTSVLSEVFPSDNSETLGTVQDNIPTPEGVPVYDYLDMTKWVNEHPATEYPPIRFLHAKNDSVVTWPEKPAFYEAAKSNALSIVGYWDQSEHTGDQTYLFPEFINERGFWSSQNKPGFNIFAFRKDRSFLAFTDCPLDQNPGSGPPSEGDPLGGVNRFLWWNTASVVDEPERYEAVVFLMPQAPSEQTTADVTVRNVQRLIRSSGTIFEWSNRLEADGTLLQPSGTVGLDAHGRLRLPAVVVGKSASRIVIRPLRTWYRDWDGDGAGILADQVSAAEPPPGYVAVAGDCDDAEPAIHPNAVEVCDGKDNDCDGATDEELPQNTWYRDADADGYGVSTDTQQTCDSTPPIGFVALTGDCDDTDLAINPGAVEVCDGKDNDCDGSIDEELPQNTWYRDADADGFGTATDTKESCGTEAPAGYVAVAGDCDDTDLAINPGAVEVCDGRDNDCDGSIDEELPQTTWYRDADSDGFGTAADTKESCDTTAPIGYAALAGDCDDAEPAIHPNAVETCDGKDNDCDGATDEELPQTTWYRDADSDGFGVGAETQQTCDTTAPAGYVAVAGDCDDADPAINPNAVEVCDGKDNDCDGSIDEELTQSTWYRDADADGVGTATDTKESCGTEAPAGYVAVAGDCDDAEPAIHPNAIEVCDGKDNDCDGAIDEELPQTTWCRDADGDGFGTAAETKQTCDTTAPIGYAALAGDCDDAEPAIHPNAIEVCDGKDNDCDGATDEDLVSETTVVVRPSESAGWSFRAQGTGSTATVGEIVGGAGALRLAIGELGLGEAEAGTSAYDGTPLRDFGALSYRTLVLSGPTGVAPYLRLSVDRDADGLPDDLLYFEPASQALPTTPTPPQGPVILGEWQAWNALAGAWWAQSGDGGATPETGVKPLAAYLAIHPLAVVRGSAETPGISILAGREGQQWAGLVGATDAVVVTCLCRQTRFRFQPDPDGTAPIIAGLLAEPFTISPADGRMAPVALRFSASDDRDPVPAVTVGVEGGEPGDAVVNDSHSLRLRAVAGRTYVVRVEARDAAGNTASGSLEIGVSDGTPTGPWGDVDADGRVTTLDAERVLAYTADPSGLEPALADRIRRYGDVNGTVNRTTVGNGTLDGNDVARLGLMSAGLADAGTCGPDTPGYGDVDGDGSVTMVDSVMASRARAGLLSPEAQSRATSRGGGDVSPTVPFLSFGDGVIDQDDVRVILARATGSEAGAPAYPDYWPMQVPSPEHPEVVPDTSTFRDLGPGLGSVVYLAEGVEELGGYTVTRVAGSDGSLAGLYKGIDGSIYVAYMEHPPTLGPRRFRFTSPLKLLDAAAATGGRDSWSGVTSSYAPDLGTKPARFSVTVLSRGDRWTPAAGPYPLGSPPSAWSGTIRLRLDIGLLASPDSAIEMQQAFFFDLAPGVGLVARGQASLQGATEPTPDRPLLEAERVTVRGRSYSSSGP